MRFPRVIPLGFSHITLLTFAQIFFFLLSAVAVKIYIAVLLAYSNVLS